MKISKPSTPVETNQTNPVGTISHGSDNKQQQPVANNAGQIGTQSVIPSAYSSAPNFGYNNPLPIMSSPYTSTAYPVQSQNALPVMNNNAGGSVVATGPNGSVNVGPNPMPMYMGNNMPNIAGTFSPQLPLGSNNQAQNILPANTFSQANISANGGTSGGLGSTNSLANMNMGVSSGTMPQPILALQQQQQQQQQIVQPLQQMQQLSLPLPSQQQTPSQQLMQSFQQMQPLSQPFSSQQQMQQQQLVQPFQQMQQLSQQPQVQQQVFQQQQQGQQQQGSLQLQQGVQQQPPEWLVQSQFQLPIQQQRQLLQAQSQPVSQYQHPQGNEQPPVQNLNLTQSSGQWQSQNPQQPQQSFSAGLQINVPNQQNDPRVNLSYPAGNMNQLPFALQPGVQQFQGMGSQGNLLGPIPIAAGYVALPIQQMGYNGNVAARNPNINHNPGSLIYNPNSNPSAPVNYSNFPSAQQSQLPKFQQQQSQQQMSLSNGLEEGDVKGSDGSVNLSRASSYMNSARNLKPDVPQTNEAVPVYYSNRGPVRRQGTWTALQTTSANLNLNHDNDEKLPPKQGVAKSGTKPSGKATTKKNTGKFDLQETPSFENAQILSHLANTEADFVSATTPSSKEPQGPSLHFWIDRAIQIALRGQIEAVRYLENVETILRLWKEGQHSSALAILDHVMRQSMYLPFHLLTSRLVAMTSHHYMSYEGVEVQDKLNSILDYIHNYHQAEINNAIQTATANMTINTTTTTAAAMTSNSPSLSIKKESPKAVEEIIIPTVLQFNNENPSEKEKQKLEVVVLETRELSMDDEDDDMVAPSILPGRLNCTEMATQTIDTLQSSVDNINSTESSLSRNSDNSGSMDKLEGMLPEGYFFASFLEDELEIAPGVHLASYQRICHGLVVEQSDDE
eukprot:scaffold96_cov167-Ochromonas_danica.AAC.35